MVTAAQRRQHERWLLQVTGIPTAAGHEDRVVRWVRRWVAARSDLTVRADRVGNLLVRQRRRSSRSPLLMTAHLDHPAFVVREVMDDGLVELEFRGGVHEPYFENAPVELLDRRDRRHRARIIDLDAQTQPFKRVRVRLGRAASSLRPGDIGRWAFRTREPVIRRGRLHAPACDDLAAVAAALSALDVLRRRRGAGHVGVLLTVAEEIGFIGAIAACKHRTVPRGARLVCLENSRSFPDSPLGAGPIVRVGDRLSVFSPELTNRIGGLLEAVSREDRALRYQRKLMPGGACEATAFASYGHESTCLCLPLANYHNMADIDGVLAGSRPARVTPESISVGDYHGLVRVLVHCAALLDAAVGSSLRSRMERLWRERGYVVGKKGLRD